MPNSMPSASAEVRACISSILPSSELTEVDVGADYEPILLLRKEHIVAAFAFANGDLYQSYENLYRGFKDHYAAQQGRWDKFDVSFVFCVQPDSRELDQFSSEVETDVYFCRKFVVPLGAPLTAALARLPFLPLEPLSEQPLRPPSAQTYLQRCGVPAELAEYLVVQKRRSPDRIVEDCLSSRFGAPPEVGSAPAQPGRGPSVQSESVRLQEVEVENFRAYRKAQVFKLGEDITLMYGPNGFGKTSFFDAIDFGATGEIGRLHLSGKQKFVRVARHLDSSSDLSQVKLKFRCNGAVQEVVRSVDDPNKASLNGETTDRKRILSKLTGRSNTATEQVSHLVRLFRASHLFSQEQQELVRDFHEDCRLSDQVVSRMLALEDYANGVAKASKVATVLERAIAKSEKEIKTLSEQKSQEKGQLSRLTERLEDHAKIDSLDARIDELRAKVEVVGIDAGSGEPDARMLRGWRAALESQHSESVSAEERLTALTTDVGELPEVHAELKELETGFEEKQKTLGVAEKGNSTAQLALQDLRKKAADLASKRQGLQSRLALLDWVSVTRPDYLRLADQERLLAQKVKAMAGELATLHELRDRAAETLRSAESRAAQARQQFEAHHSDLESAMALASAMPSWQKKRARLESVFRSVQQDHEKIEALKTEHRKLAKSATTLSVEEKGLSAKISEVDRDQSELRKLVSQLQKQIRTGVCPLCGDDHGSKAALRRSIQEHLEIDAATDARAQISKTRDQLTVAREKLAKNEAEQTGAKTHLASLDEERTTLEDDLRHLTARASKFGITLDSGGTDGADAVNTLVAGLQKEEVAFKTRVEQAEASEKSARKSAASVASQTAAKESQHESKRAKLDGIRKNLAALRGDPRTAEVALEIEPSKLSELRESDEKKLRQLESGIKKNDAQLEKRASESSRASEEISTLRETLESLRTRSARLRATVVRISARLEEFGVPADSTKEDLLALVSEQTKLQAKLLVLRDTALSLESALDASTTAAALVSLQESIRDREAAIRRAKATRDGYRPWLRCFQEVSRLLSSKQNEATVSFTRGYGPRTSIMQRRLRAVYGFDDIEINSVESSITVRVTRNGQALRPIDFFSQSQQQTLLLGLFLTACTSQTWSSFSPVLLDDPVTHFDDLNVYSLLDLTLGLIESEHLKRQFVISTCDEKLLQLARQKFRNLGDRVKFYVFNSIGDEGPNVEEL